MDRSGRLLVCTTTLPQRAAAEHIAEALVREDLAACAQVGADLVSFYRWEGEVQRDQEVQLTLKVATDRWEACARRLVELHPHDVPQVVAWWADRVERRYLLWAEGGEA
ncbi:MAG: divalent-cation tolerance protein CutA [Candidatus Krumholzibacteriia bacterium]